MSIQGNGIFLTGIFYDNHHDHEFHQSDYEIQCERQFLGTMKHDDSYLENMMIHQNYYGKGVFSGENTLEEFLTRIRRDALYDPTIESNHVNDFNFRYYPNGLHYFGKIPRTYELPEYIHRCYHGGRHIVCVVMSDENDKYALSNHKISYLSESKLRWLIT